MAPDQRRVGGLVVAARFASADCRRSGQVRLDPGRSRLVVLVRGFESADGVWSRAAWTNVEPLQQYRAPRSWWNWLAAKSAGALGLVVGLFIPVIGVAAAVGPILYFLRAAATTVRTHSYQTTRCRTSHRPPRRWCGNWLDEHPLMPRSVRFVCRLGGGAGTPVPAPP
ncbi:DoxX family protein [Saccharothrix obliqua]|uniref:DoxX family protein n=1 Tax=Saccharothrix obliqua TaxID=2861747 RepID=UPI001C5FD21A|nr:DoxX family protein [Saccharothrix obliqua]MBW4721604.1 DoxX family protein [Saccharothrix obliqua]